MNTDVLLACYNGSAFISEQIHSILNQTHKNFILYIRDDGSTDSTLDIINGFDDDRIVLIKDSHLNVGVARNFQLLMEQSKSEYILFADQDDYWYETKLEKLLGIAESKFNKNLPSMVYSAGEVVDSNLSSLGVKTVGSNCIDSMSDVLFLNGGVQGCAMLINRPLLSHVLKDNSYWYMHDQIVTLYCSIFGRVHFTDEVLFSYRQHGSNVLGHSSLGILGNITAVLFGNNDLYLVHKKSFDSINSFYINNYNILDENTRNILKSFILICKSNKLLALLIIIKSSFKLKSSKLRLLLKVLVCKELVGK